MNLEKLSCKVIEDENPLEIRAEAQLLKCQHCDFQAELDRNFKKHENSIVECEICQKIFCTKSVP